MKNTNIYTVTVTRSYAAPHPYVGSTITTNIPGCSLKWAKNWKALEGTSDGYGITFEEVTYRRTT